MHMSCSCGTLYEQVGRVEDWSASHLAPEGRETSSDSTRCHDHPILEARCTAAVVVSVGSSKMSSRVNA